MNRRPRRTQAESLRCSFVALCQCKPLKLICTISFHSEIYCKTLEAPIRGVIIPSICTQKYGNIPIGTACKVNCSQGFELTAPTGQPLQNTATCQNTGTWSHATASCHRKLTALFFIVRFLVSLIRHLYSLELIPAMTG